MDRHEQNLEQAIQFCKETGAIFAISCSQDEAYGRGASHDVRCKGTKHLRIIPFLTDGIPQGNRYVLFTPQAFLDLKDAALLQIELERNCLVSEISLGKQAITLASELKVRQNLLQKQLAKIKKNPLLRVLCWLFRIDLDVLQKHKRDQLGKTYRGDAHE